MSDEVTLTQLAAQLAQLRQQMEIVTQRLDMIYGAVTRLADTQPGPKDGKIGEQPSAPSSASAGMPLSADMMMDPGSMLDSLRQYALNLGMDISAETVDRLKSDMPPGETQDESK